MRCIKIIYFLKHTLHVLQLQCLTRAKGQGLQILFDHTIDACINQILRLVWRNTWLLSVTHCSVDRYLCEVDIVVVKGKDLVVEVSARSRGIACKRSWRKMTLTRRKSCTCNGKHAAADGVATGPASPTSAESGATSVYTPNPNKGTHHPHIDPRSTIL